MYTVKYINFWNNNGDIQDRWLTTFIEKNLNIKLIETQNNNETPDIVISSCFGNLDYINKYKNVRCKIFFYGENLNRYPQFKNFEKLKKIF